MSVRSSKDCVSNLNDYFMGYTCRSYGSNRGLSYLQLILSNRAITITMLMTVLIESIGVLIVNTNDKVINI